MVTRIRHAQASDQTRLANLIYFDEHVHRHLDWRSPFDWLGAPEYWVIEQDDVVVAVLACPPDPEKIAWLRLFAHSNQVALKDAWHALWQTALNEIPAGLTVAAIGMSPWVQDLLRQSNFRLTQQIIMLEYTGKASPRRMMPPEISLRSMNFQDLPDVTRLDATAFTPLWRNSLPALQQAFRQAQFASIATRGSSTIGYQISTKTPVGAHLARLAVDPSSQNSGIGCGLLQELLFQAQRANIRRITVNTQNDNAASLALYQKIGFRRTGEQYPVYTYFM